MGHSIGKRRSTNGKLVKCLVMLGNAHALLQDGNWPDGDLLIDIYVSVTFCNETTPTCFGFLAKCQLRISRKFPFWMSSVPSSLRVIDILIVRAY
jgi:hypothetical protein